ncbi:MAG TPA: hypothetical protein VHL10_00720 [Nitrososphaera sp.]|jgi:hypothetical protein|nr:hypothetical protein [Nitrososphaera sp.]
MSKLREVKQDAWQDIPVIAVFGDGPLSCYVGINGIAASNYTELAGEAWDAISELRDKLMLQDLDFVGDDIEEMSLTIDLDAEDDEEVQEAGPEPSGHNFFTCPPEIAARAKFLRVGDRVTGVIDGHSVTGVIESGWWRRVTIRTILGDDLAPVPVVNLRKL